MLKPVWIAVTFFVHFVIGHPENLRSVAFPESALWEGMRATGYHKPSIFNHNTNTIRCQNGEGMIAVFASGSDSIPGATRNTERPEWNRYEVKQEQNWNTGRQVNFVSSAKSIKIMCARNRKQWSYTAYSINRGNHDPFVIPSGTITSDIIVVGSGVGGLSVAAALGPHFNTVVISPAPSASTSARSTGVVWFPNASKHTVQMLLEAKGAPANDNDGRLKAYLDQGNDAFAFWDERLRFKTFTSLDGNHTPSYDYTNYTSGEQQGQSFQANVCAGASECGQLLVGHLKNISGATIVSGVARAIEKTPSQEFAIFLKNRSAFAVAPIVIIATGGDGSSSIKYNPENVLAADNNGFARKVALQLDLKPASANDSFYHLEYESNSQGADWDARWFAANGCVPSSLGFEYDLCNDYSTRAQSLDVNVTYSTKVGAYECTTNHGFFWKMYIKDYYARINYPLNYSSCQPNIKLRAGIIDSKAGFKLNTHYESVDQQRLFASGTSAAAFTKDAYFAPGATLGLGLVTGHEISKLIPQRLAEFKAMQKGTADGNQVRSCIAPFLFIAGVWLAAVGIFAHMSENPTIKWVHYVAMPAAVIMITAGVFVARECSRETNTPKYVKTRGGANGTYHYLAGYILLGVLWAQVALGIGLKALKGKKSSLLASAGIAHRVLGALLFILLAVQYLTVLYPRDKYAMKYYDTSYDALTIPGVIFTVWVGGYIAFKITRRVALPATNVKASVDEIELKPFV